jgi:D-amino-acid oxidase
MSDPLEFQLRKVGNDLILGHRPAPATRAPPSKRVLVIGGGVTGLTTAWALLDAGFGVVVLSDQWAPASPRIVSQVAGALYIPFLHFSFTITKFAH